MEQITLVITACNRPDLLKKTFASFIKYNTYPIQEYIIIEDSEVPKCNDFLLEQYPNLNIKLIYNSKKLGQCASIDYAYSLVSTPWIYHCEEDWEFFRSGFIEESLELMEMDPRIITVQTRSTSDNFSHPRETSIHSHNSIEYQKLIPGYNILWYGFTFNPSLKRVKDYKLIGGSYSKLSTRVSPKAIKWDKPNEGDISWTYGQMGYYGVILTNPCLRHLGWGRNTHLEGGKLTF